MSRDPSLLQPTGHYMVQYYTLVIREAADFHHTNQKIPQSEELIVVYTEEDETGDPFRNREYMASIVQHSRHTQDSRGKSWFLEKVAWDRNTNFLR